MKSVSFYSFLSKRAWSQTPVMLYYLEDIFVFLLVLIFIYAKPYVVLSLVISRVVSLSQSIESDWQDLFCELEVVKVSEWQWPITLPPQCNDWSVVSYRSQGLSAASTVFSYSSERCSVGRLHHVQGLRAPSAARLKEDGWRPTEDEWRVERRQAQGESPL